MSLHTFLHDNFSKNYLSLSGAETLLCCLGDVLQVPLLWTFVLFLFFLFSFLLSFVFPCSMVVLVNFCFILFLYLLFIILVLHLFRCNVDVNGLKIVIMIVSAAGNVNGQLKFLHDVSIAATGKLQL